MDILKPKKQLLRIYPLFHFIPGDLMNSSARRRDGKLHFLCTTPDSDNAKMILDHAFNSKNIYRIGIACHGYADTWAHQNFIGYYDSCNAIGVLKQKPTNIGHADALHDPDEINNEWPDHRLLSVLSTRNNNEIFLQATGRIFEELKRYKCPLCQRQIIKRAKEELLDDLRKIIYLNNQYERIEGYCELAKREKYGGQGLIHYNEDKWFKEAVFEKFRGLKVLPVKGIFRLLNIYLYEKIRPLRNIYFWKDVKTYKNTDWYQFQEAVKDYQKESYKILYESTLKEMEIENW